MEGVILRSFSYNNLMNSSFFPGIGNSSLPYNYAQNSIIKSNKHFKKAVDMLSCTFYDNKIFFDSNFLKMKNFLLYFFMFVWISYNMTHNWYCKYYGWYYEVLRNNMRYYEWHTNRAHFPKIRLLFCKFRTLFFLFSKRAGETPSPSPPLVSRLILRGTTR